MTWHTFVQKLDRLDKTIYENILIYADPEWVRTISHFLVKNNHIAPLLILFFLIYIYKNPKENFKNSIYLFLATAVLLGVSETTASIFKDLFGRPRPVYQMGIYISNGGYSLPSAHAVNTMAFAVLWSNRFKSAAPWLFTFSLIIGAARMFANFHFPGDVLFGWITGYIVGKIFVFTLNKFEERFKGASLPLRAV